MIKYKNLKLACVFLLVVSVLIPVISLAQSSSNQASSQVVTSSSYAFDVPTGFAFSPVFVNADATVKVQKILTPGPTQEDTIVKFTDLRGASGGAFSINAYMSNLTTATEGATTINANQAGIATRHANNDGYTVDFDADNFLSPDQETVTGPVSYNDALVDSEIPSNFYTYFANASTGINIMNGSLGEGESGRTGAYSVGPALIINLPTNNFGSFSGNVTFELVLS